MTVTVESADAIVPYVPRQLLDWEAGAPRYRTVEGSLVSADISGFTALSERLARHGREGAEELTLLLNRCFGGMIEIVDEHGGDVLKFGGDALLILFTGAAHAARAASACQAMRSLIQRPWSTELVAKINLGISQGVHSGEFGLHLVDAGYEELWVVGPGMTSTVRCEDAAERGEILLSHDAAALLDASMLGVAKEHGRPLVGAVEVVDLAAAASPSAERATSFVPDWLVEQAGAGRAAGEHRVVSVGFVFFGGVDDLVEQRGHEGLHAALQQLADVTRDAVERHGVYWLASDVYPGGGKIILTAGAPRSTGQDEDAAVRAGRSIVEAGVELPVRVGLNRGAVFMGDLGSPTRRTFTVMGDAVNLAARLMQKAGTGQMVASRSLLDQVPSGLVLEDLEPFEVKGKSEPIEAALVGAVLGSQLESAATSSDHDIGFVGREAELDLLHGAVERTCDGTGVVIDLVGEPGIGKTRLVQQVLASHPTVQVLRTSGGLYSRGSPYFATRQFLRPLAGISTSASSAEAGVALSEWVAAEAPELAVWLPLLAIPFDADVPPTPEVDRIDSANRPQKIRSAVSDLLDTVQDRPTVIVVEDAYWLDEASDELFAFLSERTRRRSWMIIALRRVDTDCFASRDRGAVAIELGPLSADATRVLAAAAINAGLGSDLDDLDELLARGTSNPLFILELVRAGVDDATPDSIEALITARIDTLSAADRSLLREGAVLGATIDTELLSEASEDADLTRLGRWAPLASFLDRQPDHTLRFRHGLYRDVAYGGLSYRRRIALHAAVGTVIERRSGDAWEESSELLSTHFHAARDWTRSWRYSAAAGERARGKYANREAADYYRRALTTPKRTWPADAEVAVVAESLGDVLELAGRLDEADVALSQARKFTDDSPALVRLMRKEGIVRERQGRYTQALRWYGRALRMAETGLPPDAAALAQGNLALAYAAARFRQGQTERCITWAHRAERIATDLDDHAMLAHASYLLLIGYGVLRRPEAADYRDRPLPLFEELGDLVGQANVLNNLGVDAKEQGRWSEALDLYEQSRVAREQAGDVIGEATASNNIAEILSDQGHLDEAEALLDHALRDWRRVRYPVGVAMATSYLGRLAARRGEYDTARHLLSDAHRRFEEIDAGYFVLETRILEIEAEVLAGNPGNIVIDHELMAAVDAMGDPLQRAILLRINAWLARQHGDDVEAERLADEAIRVAEGIGYDYEVALSLIMRGMILEATGRDRGADHRRARRLLEGLGVVRLPEIHSPA